MKGLLLAAALASAAPAAIATERLDETSFLLRTDSNSTAAVADEQARVQPAAAKACGSRRPVLGRYRFLTENGKRSFEQELLCLSPGHRLDVATAAGSGADLAPSRADQQAVLAASYAYFAAKDRGRHADAYRILAERTKTRFPLAGWSEAARAFYAEAGAPLGRRIVEITWYDNPADAPEPGLYVAADWSAEFDKAEFVCGYLVWRVQADGSLGLMREEQNIAPKRPNGRAIAAIDRDPLRARMGCKD